MRSNLLGLAAGVVKGTVCIAAVAPAAVVIGIHRMLLAVFPAVAAASALMAVVHVRSGSGQQILLASCAYAVERNRTQ